MLHSLSLLLVAMLTTKKELGLKWQKKMRKDIFWHIHIANNTPILILIFICWNIIAQRE